MQGRITRTIQRVVAESGLSANEIAVRSKVNPAQLSRFLNDKRSLTLPAVEQLCEVLGLELRQTRKPKRKAKP
jgi:transcriptional regulator with XRE-family HTH domain